MGKRGSAWLRSKNSKRFVNTRESLPKILIVNEGLKTEPQYFHGFRVPTVDLHIVPAGRIHLSVVRMTIKLMKEARYDEVWCVFDRDKNPKNKKDSQQFNEAMSLAAANGINVAYSNDAFELWYLLHFNYMKSAIGRHDYIDKLNDYLPTKYEKGDKEMFSKLEDKMDTAIRNAKKLHNSYDSEDPLNNDPSTTVYKLVERLREFSRG